MLVLFIDISIKNVLLYSGLILKGVRSRNLIYAGLCPAPHNFFEKKLSKSQFVFKIWNIYFAKCTHNKIKAL